MDITIEYRKMCDCPEIQEAWKPRWGDYILEDGMVFVSVSVKAMLEDRAYLIWLPKQDQLQDMFTTYSNGERYRRFDAFITDFRIWRTLGDYVSLEKLWLMFVMHEKYHKIWDKEWK